MITVADIINLPSFERAELAVDVPGALRRPVWNMGILDRLPSDEMYSDFLPGEFIVSNVMFAEDDPGATSNAIELLLSRNVAALAVNSKHMPKLEDISPSVLRASYDTGVPLFLYDGAYIEVIAYQGLDLIRRDEAQADKRRVVDSLISSDNSDKTRDAIYGLTGATGSAFQCIALSPKAEDDVSLFAILGAVGDELGKMKMASDDVETVYACRYRDMILAFASFSQSKGAMSKTSDVGFSSSREMGFSDWITAMPGVVSGVGERYALPDGDLSVLEAISGLSVARSEGRDVVFWEDIDIGAYRFAAAASRLYDKTSERHVCALRSHDSVFGTQIELTCRALAESYGDIKCAARISCSHPNTVRYRIKQAKKILGLEGMPDRQFVFLLGLMFLKDGNTIEPPR